jgi:hypothetical protein
VEVAKVFKEMLGLQDAVAYLERNGFSSVTAQALLVAEDAPAIPAGGGCEAVG